MSTAAPVQGQAATSPSVIHSTHAGLLLQRKCACGGSAGLTGDCEGCRTDKLLGANGARVQRKLAIGASNDPLEQEADRVADQVVAKRTASSSVSPLAVGRLQREEAPKDKTNEEKYQEGLEKLGEAFLKTPLGKEILEKIKQDTLVKGATEFGKDVISTWPGKIVTGAAATGTVAALYATHKELPAQIPEIPLNVLTPGLSVQLTYKGPVDKPTEAMITFKFTEQAPKNSTDKKPMSEADKFLAETARLAAEDAKFRAGMTYMPGSPEDLQQKAEQEAVRKAALKYSGGLDIDATIKKYPWLATPQPKSGLQLTMPKPSFGTQPPSLLGDEFKLKSPVEQKKKQDEPSMQRKLSIGASNDPLEQEADRVADQVLAAPAHAAVSGAPPRIQRFTRQATEGSDTTPVSVDRVLASAGRPLEPALQQDMEQRFGHDFSQVRVHSGAAAERSARDVNANAYTVGHSMVFGEGRFAPGTHEGRRLIAHELTHVVQQSDSDGIHVGQGGGKPGLLPISQYKVDGVIQMQPKPSATKQVVPEITIPDVYIYDSSYKQQFINKCGEANTVVDLAEHKYSAWLSANAAAYATAWQNHDEMLKSLERSYKLFEEIAIGSFLALVPGGIGGAIGKTLKGLGNADFIIDGVKDLVKFELRSPIPGDIGKVNTGQIFKPMPANPLVWQNLANQRAQEELGKATEAVLSWQHAMNSEENVDLRFDPVATIKAALTLDDQSLLSLEPPDVNATRKKFEAAWLLTWINLYWFETAISLIPVTINNHENKIADYGESLGIDRPTIKKRMSDVYWRDYKENNERAIKQGHTSFR